MSILTLSEKKALRTYADNMTWFRVNYTRLAGEHPNNYVAINNGDVIDSDTDPRRLIDRLRSKYGGENITTFAIGFVSKNDVELII